MRARQLNTTKLILLYTPGTAAAAVRLRIGEDNRAECLFTRENEATATEYYIVVISGEIEY